MIFSNDLENISIDDLILMYREAAAAHGLTQQERRFLEGNPYADRMQSIVNELKQRGADALHHLLLLLDDENVAVRCWSASEVLKFLPEEGERVLSELATGTDWSAFNARMTLQEWRKQAQHNLGSSP